MMKLRIVVWIMALAMAVNASAQEPELKVKPSGRILFDAAYVHAQQQEDKLKGGGRYSRYALRSRFYLWPVERQD